MQHMAMALRGHVVLDLGGDGRRFVWPIGFTIRFLSERLAHRIPRSSGNVAIGSYLGPSSPWSLGIGTMVLIPRRPESCQRGPLSETASALPQNLPQEFTTDLAANRGSHGAAHLGAPGGSNLTALLTG